MFPEISQAMLVVLLDVLHANDPARVDTAIEKGQRTIDLIVSTHLAKSGAREAIGASDEHVTHIDAGRIALDLALVVGIHAVSRDSARRFVLHQSL